MRKGEGTEDRRREEKLRKRGEKKREGTREKKGSIEGWRVREKKGRKEVELKRGR